MGLWFVYSTVVISGGEFEVANDADGGAVVIENASAYLRFQAEVEGEARHARQRRLPDRISTAIVLV